MPEERVVIVGAGAGGLATADAVRVEGHAGPVVMLGDEKYPPYDRPPLSKQVLSGTWEPGRVELRTAVALTEAGVDLRLGTRAVGVDGAARSVVLADGSSVDYDRLVVATGADARRLPFGHDLAGVHVLRDLDEALALKAEIAARPALRLVVIGAGFLGSEVVASARVLGAEVALVDTLDLPLTTVLGAQLGAMIADLHREHGVDLHLGRGVASFGSANGAVSSVVLDDGTELAADLVVVAIGATPAVAWLRASAVPIAGPTPGEGAGGVQCDAVGHAGAGVYAVGDVAAWWSEDDARYVRVEHRLTANEHALAVAREISGTAQPATRAVPYFWSDQYDLKLQSFGLPSGRDEFAVVDGSLEERRFVAVYGHDGRVTAVAGAGMAKAVRGWRQALAERRAWAGVVVPA